MPDTPNQEQQDPWMPLASGGPARKSLLSKLNMPIGAEMKNQLDSYLNQYVNVPLAESGHPDTGAAISSALSTTGEMLIPDNLAEAAMYYFPAGKIVKAGKGMSKLIPGLEKAGALDYKAMEQGEKAAADLNREKQAVNANTLKYDKAGNIELKKAPEDMLFDPETNKFK